MPFRARVPLLLPALCLLLAAPAAPAQSGAGPRFTLADVLDTRSLGAALLSPDGSLAVVTAASLRDRIGVDNTRFGDPTYLAPGVAEAWLVDTRTGRRTPLVEGRRSVRGLAWAPGGARLAWLERRDAETALMIWDRATGRTRAVALPAGRQPAESGPLQWSGDGARLLFSLRTDDWRREARERFVRETRGPIVVQSSEEPFLSWDAIRRLGLRQIVALYDATTGRIRELVAEGFLSDYRLSEDGTTLSWYQDVTAGTDYTQIFGRENRLRAMTLDADSGRVVMASLKGLTLRWAGDGLSFAYAREGALWVRALADTSARKLAGPPPAGADTAPADTAARRLARAARDRERFTPVRLSHRGDLLVAQNSEALWMFDVATGSRQKIVDTPPDSLAPDAPRWTVAEWSRDGRDLYLARASRTAWERGYARWDRTTGALQPLISDSYIYGDLQLSDDGATLAFTRAPGNQPADLWVADRDFATPRRLTEINPGLDAKVTRTALVDYLDADGRKLYGVLYYPQDYREGVRYPTVFIVYETFFDDRFNATISYLNALGYAVMQPSVHLAEGRPGEAWLKGVTAAANRLIEMGIADRDRLGVHGTSYGGYATNLLVAQTGRFAAAINISGKTDMISFYTDSPRLGTRNTHAPERSQDRIGGTLWEHPLKYLEHSAVMYADRITTPLLLMTGREDHNVPERTTSEMFYALRRLGKRVEWVSYVNGGHGMPTTTVAEVEDYHRRIAGWYDRYLRKEGHRTAGGPAAP